MRPGAAPIFVATLLGLAGALGATLQLHRAASDALDRVLEERLRGAGETAARLLEGRDATGPRLREIMLANRLDGAYVVSPRLEVLADAMGPGGGPADLLRVDAARVSLAARGEISVGAGYDVGGLVVETAYFPLRSPSGSVQAVLALEAGEPFATARAGLRRALAIGIGLSCVGALALALAAAGWSRSERLQRDAAARAARGDAVARMAAGVAHEIRNPLGIIRAAVELVRERVRDGVAARDRERLDDVLGEVERLRQLTEDFLDLAADRPLQREPTGLGDVVAEAARGSAALHPAVDVRIALQPLPAVTVDRGRLRQVFANLLANAAQAGARSVEITGEAGPERIRIAVKDDGAGVPPEVRARLFEPFASGREGGTGLGLAISRRVVERHGGSLVLLPQDGRGAAFELTLPVRA